MGTGEQRSSQPRQGQGGSVQVAQLEPARRQRHQRIGGEGSEGPGGQEALTRGRLALGEARRAGRRHQCAQDQLRRPQPAGERRSASPGEGVALERQQREAEVAQVAAEDGREAAALQGGLGGVAAGHLRRPQPEAKRGQEERGPEQPAPAAGGAAEQPAQCQQGPDEQARLVAEGREEGDGEDSTPAQPLPPTSPPSGGFGEQQRGQEQNEDQEAAARAGPGHLLAVVEDAKEEGAGRARRSHRAEAQAAQEKQAEAGRACLQQHVEDEIEAAGQAEELVLAGEEQQCQWPVEGDVRLRRPERERRRTADHRGQENKVIGAEAVVEAGRIDTQPQHHQQAKEQRSAPALPLHRLLAALIAAASTSVRPGADRQR